MAVIIATARDSSCGPTDGRRLTACVTLKWVTFASAIRADGWADMNAKAKGTRNEHRSMAVLEAAGYRCTRSAASLANGTSSPSAAGTWR